MLTKGGFDTCRMATGTFVVRMNNADDTEGARPEDFESLITALGLRPLGSVIVRTHEHLTEFRIDIEYGPAIGELEGTLRLMLKQMAPSRADTACELFDYRHRDATQVELQAEMSRLKALSNDMALPLKQCRELSDKANQLRKYVNE